MCDYKILTFFEVCLMSLMDTLTFCSLVIHFVLLRGIPQLLRHWTSIQIKRTLSALVITIVRLDIGVSGMVVVLEYSRLKACAYLSSKSIELQNLYLTFYILKSSIMIVICQGGATQMRFQPGFGRMLAAAADNYVSILDIDTQVCRLKLQVFP